MPFQMSATELNEYCRKLELMLVRLASRIRIDNYGGPPYVCGEDEVSEVMLEVSEFLASQKPLKLTKNNPGPVAHPHELTLWAIRRLPIITDTSRKRQRREFRYLTTRPDFVTDGSGGQPASAEHPIFARQILEALFDYTLPNPVAHRIFRLILSSHLRPGTLNINPCDWKVIAEITGDSPEEVSAAHKHMVTLKDHLLDQPPSPRRKKRKPRPKKPGRRPRATKGMGDLP